MQMKDNEQVCCPLRAILPVHRSEKRHRCRLEGVNFVRIPPQVMRVAVNHLELVATKSETLYMKVLIVQLEDKEVAWFHLHEAGWRRKHKLYQRFNTAENSAPRTNFTSLYNTLDAFQSVFWARTRQRITFSISFPSPLAYPDLITSGANNRSGRGE